MQMYKLHEIAQRIHAFRIKHKLCRDNMGTFHSKAISRVLYNIICFTTAALLVAMVAESAALACHHYELDTIVICCEMAERNVPA